MGVWYTEQHTKDVRFSIKIKKQLAGVKSFYQQIDLYDTYEFGRMLSLDGFLMVTEKDEFIYHDMITHVPMAVNPSIAKVLVIGAGDGGVVRELCRYPSVEEIRLVEIDEEVIRLCKEFLPQTACCLDDHRVTITIEDGLKFVRTKQDCYDLIIVDSTDPFGPGEGLFTREFYGNCYKALKAQGILVNQHESPYYRADALAMQRTHRLIQKEFPIGLVYQAHIPTYPSGHWLFGFASKGLHPISDLKEKEWNELGLKTDYYNTKLHQGAFALPNYVKELLNP